MMILCRLFSSGFSLSLFSFSFPSFFHERLFFHHKKKNILVSLFLFLSFLLSFADASIINARVVFGFAWRKREREFWR